MSDPNPQVSPREDEHAVVHVAECPTTPTNEAANTHSANGNSNGASGDVAPHVKKQPEEKARASDAPAAAEDDGEKKPSQKFVPIAITYRFDEDTFNEMIERRNMDVLKDTFGGVEGMARTFDSDLKGGIRSDTLSTRYDQFGPNVLATKEPVTFWEFLLEAFQDKIIILLCITALVSIVFGLTLPNPHSGDVERATGWIEGGAILVSVFIVTMTGAINNYRKAKKFEEMEQEQSVKDVSVMRDGKDITITSDTITVGDVLTINTGMEMVCDGLLIGGHDLKMNESAISGEPDLIDKGDDDAFIISGTTADEGNGKMLVVAIGMSSFQGQLKDTLSEEVGETPLQEHLSVLADDIGKIGLAAALLLFVSLSIKEGILIANDTRSGGSSSAVRFLNFFLVAVTLIAVAIPEGLPLAVTISLAFSMRAMMKDQCMVRVLASCETMGAATAIASDKTGTLTTNQMTVVQGCVAEKEFVLRGYELHCRTKEVPQLSRDAPEYPMNAAALEHFCRALSVNSTAVEAEVDGKLIWTGNKTEAGLLGFVKSAGHSYQDSRAKVEGSMKQFPFSSLKKRMTTVVREKNGELLGYFKGASETILETCKQYIDADGQVSDLTEDRRELFNDVILDMANQGNRTIGVAYAPLLGTDFPEEEPEVTPIFMGVLGIQDPIREAVPDAVLHANSAGLVVRMVTGDNINTAKAIGKKCNIYAENNFDIAMTGQDFRDLYRENEQELISKLPRLRVLARSSPNDKHILVGLLQRETLDVVGVTGDGTNDAPALKLADVGFAMNTGTDIAKGAADMVLLDDNFATVVTAIKWGRAVNDNVKKFLQYQLTINAAAVALTIIGALASEESKEPIAAVQLLWLNLIMDTLAALALATELPEDASLERYPVFKQAPLITRHMWIFIGVHGVFQIAVVTLLLFLGHKWFNIVEKDGSTDCDKDFGFVAANNSFNNGTIFAKHPQRIKCDEVCTDYGGTLSERRCQQGATHSTMIFNTFIWFQIFNVVNARKLYGELNAFEGVWARSKMLLQVFAVIVVLQVLCVQFFGVFMKTVGLNWWRWLICIGLGFIELILGAVVRLIPVKDFVPPEVQQKMANEAELRTHLMHHDHHMSRSTHHRPSLLVLKGKDKAIRKASMAKGRGSFTVR